MPRGWPCYVEREQEQATVLLLAGVLMAIWCEIIFKDSSTPKRFTDVRRMYAKGGLWCVELPDKDDEGRPIILGYPLGNIFSIARPHPDHVGSEPREKE